MSTRRPFDPPADLEATAAAAGADAPAIIDVARESVPIKPVDRDTLYARVVPKGHEIATLDPTIWDDSFREAPRRKKGEVTLYTAAAFSAYVGRHDDERTTLWGDIEQDRVVAVLDDHGPDEAAPGWGEHRATLVLRHPPAWRRWLGRDGKMGTQEELAEHIEMSLPEIVSPDGATLLEVAQSFHARKNATFRSGTRLASGEVQFRYEEQVDASAGRNGELTIPETFTVALQPYEGADPFEIRARLRYRVREGHLSIGYVLERPEEALRDVFAGLVEDIARDTGIAVWEGSPRL